MLLNSRQFKFLKNYRNLNVKSSEKREYRYENVFLKGDRAFSKLITLWISNKKEFNHFFKSRSSDIVLLKLGNLNQNAKRYEARNTERDDHIYWSTERAHSCERSELLAKRAMRMCERSEKIFLLNKLYWLLEEIITIYVTEWIERKYWFSVTINNGAA